MRGDDGREWGIDPARRNRAAVRLLLLAVGATHARRPLVRKIEHRLRKAAWRVLADWLACDFMTPHFGSGLLLPHPTGVVVHGRAVIGDDVTIFQNVTIGESSSRPGVAVVGDDVLLGAGAALIGPVRIGDGATIGANAVVVDDVAPGAVVVAPVAVPLPR